METKIRAGQRVLYKDGNSGWLVGIVKQGYAEVNEQGVWIPIIPLRFIDMEEDNVPYIQYAEINTLFTEGQPLDEWMKPMLLNKEEYIQFIKSEDFERAMENAWVSDGEYYYYPVSTYTENWVNKQPFNYILRSL